VASDGYFRRGRWGKRGGGIALYIKKSMQCEELSLKNSHKQAEILWIRMRDTGNKGNFVTGIYYRLPDKAFFLLLQESLHSQALILLGDINHADICWKSSTASCRQSRRFLECIEDNFLRQVIDSPIDGTQYWT